MSVGGSHGRSHETACGADSSACLCVSSQCVNLSAGSRSMQSLRRVDPRGPAWTVDARTATARRVPAVDESVRLSTAERFPRLSTMNQCRGSHARRRSRAVGTNVEKKVERLKYTLLCQIKALED